MRLILSMLLLASPALATTGMRQPSVYGDARYGFQDEWLATNVMFSVTLPNGDHDGFTVTAWLRTSTTNGGQHFLTTQAFWCPDAFQMSNPDLLAGAGAHAVAEGTNLTDLGGSITVASFPWQPYTNAHLSPVTNKWPKGVYTLAGWTSNACTITLGGTDYTVGPGTFNRNAEPGVADSVVISGTGLVAIGISRTPCGRYFNEIDGVTDGYLPTYGYLVTNQITFCAWRFKVEGTNQIYRSDIGTVAAFNETSQTKTNAFPLIGKFSSRGDYHVGLIGVARQAPHIMELFDARVLPWCLSDQELERIHFNGVQEINRRGIPQWR